MTPACCSWSISKARVPLHHLDRADFDIELCRHLIHEFHFGGQEIPFPKRRSDYEVALTDSREYVLETIQRAGDMKRDLHGMDAMDHEHEARAERPWPVSGMEVEQIIPDDGLLLPRECTIVECLHQRSEHGNGQQRNDDQRIGENHAEHANLERMDDGPSSPTCMLGPRFGSDLARGRLKMGRGKRCVGTRVSRCRIPGWRIGGTFR